VSQQMVVFVVSGKLELIHCSGSAILRCFKCVLG
jgi:hypothetical protein